MRNCHITYRAHDRRERNRSWRPPCQTPAVLAGHESLRTAACRSNRPHPWTGDLARPWLHVGSWNVHRLRQMTDYERQTNICKIIQKNEYSYLT